MSKDYTNFVKRHIESMKGDPFKMNLQLFAEPAANTGAAGDGGLCLQDQEQRDRRGGHSGQRGGDAAARRVCGRGKVLILYRKNREKLREMRSTVLD